MTELVVELDWPGVRVGAPDKKMGNHGQLATDLAFDNVKVPLDNVVGQLGKGLKIALQTLTYGRVGIAASGAGMARALFDHSAERLKTRRVFGKAIAQFLHWQFKMQDRRDRRVTEGTLVMKGGTLRLVPPLTSSVRPFRRAPARSTPG